MPSGRKDAGQVIGHATRFTGENAAMYGKRGNEKRIANIPIRRCLKNIATQTLYGKPPLTNEQLKPIAKFFGIKISEVTFAHLAIYKQSLEMVKGDKDALNLIANYAGEKPVEKVEVSTPDYSALEEARQMLQK